MTRATVAVDKHSAAAHEFATAAKHTQNLEALRTLKLLEDHHQRLSELLKSRLEHPTLKSSSSATSDVPSPPQGDASEPRQHSHLPRAGPPARHYNITRDLTSSIASNLASARGIRSKPGQALSPAMSRDQAPGNIDAPSRSHASRSRNADMAQERRDGTTPSWRSQHSESVALQDPASGAVLVGRTSPTTESYNRFATAFGSLVTALSAPLAYAGLPLHPGPEAPPPPVASSPRRQKSSPNPASPVFVQPDISKLYSPAALKTLDLKGRLSSDSFCVVPTSGHTVSYANILSYADKEKRRQEGFGVHGEMEDIPEDADEDDFADASKTQAGLSPALQQRIGRGQGEKELRNAIEELYLENQNLKEMLDKVTRRLHAFEASAQTSSMALAESMRLMRPSSPASNVAQSDAESGRRKETERQLHDATRRIEELERDNTRKEKALGKYREKWEKLKAGAKARREAQNSLEAIPESR